MRSGKHPDSNPDLSGNMDSNPRSLLVEVKHVGGGLRSLSTVKFLLVRLLVACTSHNASAKYLKE